MSLSSVEEEDEESATGELRKGATYITYISGANIVRYKYLGVGGGG